MARKLLILPGILIALLALVNTCTDRVSTWTYYSSKAGNLSPPNPGDQQTASLVLDIDKDGTSDFVIAERTKTPSVVWYKYSGGGKWSKYPIDDTALSIEAGGDYADIDEDGDLDIVFGGDSRSNQIWWWENPCPNYDPNTPWTRRLIKNSGSNKHHDQIFGDFDGDGKAELASWNQGARQLVLFEIPGDPKAAGEWSRTAIFTAPNNKYEGLAAADIDLDGKIDIIGAGRWFKHKGGMSYAVNVIDSSAGREFTRSAAGQIIPGGRPEVVIVPGDASGPLKWYQWNGGSWIAHQLNSNIIHGHSLQVRDINHDSHLDVFVGEMGNPGAGADARTRIYWGNGAGAFSEEIIAIGKANHESRVGDLDGDGDLDVLGKPYNYAAPGLHIWLQDGPTSPLDNRQRH